MAPFVGGTCAQTSVRLHAARALEAGEGVLLRLVPGAPPPAADGADAEPGVVVAHNPCLSGGALDIFLDPQVPAARIVIAGDTPIARGLHDVAAAAGYDVVRDAAADVAPRPGDAAVIVASHGNDEEVALVRALQAGIDYIALVASPKRGAAVLASLDVPAEQRDRSTRRPGWTSARAPGGRRDRDPGRVRRPHAAAVAVAAPSPEPPAIAIDPVCGMEVVASDASLHLDVDGERVYFCREGCRATYLEEHRAMSPRASALGHRPRAGGRRFAAAGAAEAAAALRRRTLLDHALDTARACAFDQLRLRVGGAADQVRATVDLSGAEVVENRDFGDGLLVVDRRRARRRGRARRRARPAARRPARRHAGDGRGAAGGPRRRGAGRVPLRRRAGHPLAFARSTFGELSALHGDKAVWKLLDRRGGRGRRRARRGPDPARRRHVGGLPRRAGGRGRGMTGVLDTFSGWVAAGDRVVLATVVDTKRSAPQPPGTKMALDDAGACRRGLRWLRRGRGGRGRRGHPARGGAPAAALRDRRWRGLGRRAALRRRDRDLGRGLRAGRRAGALRRARARRAAGGVGHGVEGSGARAPSCCSAPTARRRARSATRGSTLPRASWPPRRCGRRRRAARAPARRCSSTSRRRRRGCSCSAPSTSRRS